MPKDTSVLMQGVKILFRNFAGKEGKFNKAGDRNFVVLLDPKTAEAMGDDGWNVKHLKPREDDEDDLIGQPYLPVAVNFRNKPPRIVMITSRGRTHLDEDTIETLDWVDMNTVDLIVNPYDYTVNDRSGRKAYLQTMFVTIAEDELELKYAKMEEEGE